MHTQAHADTRCCSVGHHTLWAQTGGSGTPILDHRTPPPPPHIIWGVLVAQWGQPGHHRQNRLLPLFLSCVGCSLLGASLGGRCSEGPCSVELPHSIHPASCVSATMLGERQGLSRTHPARRLAHTPPAHAQPHSEAVVGRGGPHHTQGSNQDLRLLVRGVTTPTHSLAHLTESLRPQATQATHQGSST